MNIHRTPTDHFIDLDITSDNGMVIDIGACVGEFIRDVISLNKNLKVIAFEPSKTNFEILKRDYGKLACINHGVVIGNAENSEPPMIFNEVMSGSKGCAKLGQVDLNLSPKYSYITYPVRSYNINNTIKDFPVIECLKICAGTQGYFISRFMEIPNNHIVKQISIEITEPLRPLVRNELMDKGFWCKEEYKHEQFFIHKDFIKE